MLVRENELRLAPETQRTYEKAEAGSLWVTDDDDGEPRCEDWLEVTDKLQRRVVREFLSCGEDDTWRKETLLRALRSATNWYPSLRSIPLYVRFNRARVGDLRPGAVFPNPSVLGLDGQRSALHALLNARTAQKTLLIVGSIS